MKRALSANVKVWHLMLTVFLMVFITGGAVFAAGSAGRAFWTSGQLYIAAQSGSDANLITVPAGYTPTSVLSKSITVPAGKTADIAAMGSVDIQGGASSGYIYCFGSFRLDSVSGPAFKPGGDYILEGFNPPANNLTVPINGWKQGIAPGPHTIYMEMNAGYADCIAQARSMILIVNVH